MKRQDYMEIVNLDELAIIGRVKKVRTEIADLVLDKNMSALKDVKAIDKKRKDLAQMLTVLKQKQMLKKFEEKTEVKVEPAKEEPVKEAKKTEKTKEEKPKKGTKK